MITLSEKFLKLNEDEYEEDPLDELPDLDVEEEDEEEDDENGEECTCPETVEVSCGVIPMEVDLDDWYISYVEGNLIIYGNPGNPCPLHDYDYVSWYLEDIKRTGDFFEDSHGDLYLVPSDLVSAGIKKTFEDFRYEYISPEVLIDMLFPDMTVNVVTGAGRRDT